MASRRDQLQAYQFMTQRVLSAFVMRETDPAQSPLRRGVGAVFAGMMIAVMVGAGFGVVGIVTKTGSNNWRTDGAVVIEKETGASFLYESGTLHPMLNYTSAVLAAGRSTAVFHEARNSLAGVPRGSTLGIPQAPDSLPGRDKLLGDPWTMCTVGVSGGRTQVTLLVGQAPLGGQPPGAQGLLVVNPDGDTYLVWQGRRYLVRQPKTVVAALFGAVTAIPVGTAWLNGLPPGADIKTITIGNQKGKPSTKVPGRKVGDLVRAQTGTGDQFYVVLDDGLAPLNALQTAIYRGQISTDASDIPVSEMTRVPQSKQLDFPTGDDAPPANPPKLAQPNAGQQLCAATAQAGALPAITIGGSIDQAGEGVATPSTSDSGSALADRVVVSGGHIAVALAVEKADATTGAYYLVTDSGRRYAVTSDAALTALGYVPSDAVKVLSSLLLRIPAGPALDPAAALRVAGD
jgi:type VII secretion protein EccB